MLTVDIELARSLLSYDPDTGILRWKVRRGSHVMPGDVAGVTDNGAGYCRVKVQKKRIYTHRLIWAMMTGYWPEKHIDHVNRVRSDNRWGNLREAEVWQNGGNKSVMRRNISGMKGVCTDNNGRYRARICVKGQKMGLGSFRSPESAADAYRKAAKHHFGEFAHYHTKGEPALRPVGRKI